MNDQSQGHEWLPRTAYLDHTLRRARTAAEQRSHRYVALEHLLLALLDDPDASKLLQLVGADVAAIHGAVADAVNNRMISLAVPGARPPCFGYRFDPLFARANEDAISIGRGVIDGALALVAIAKDAESNASGILLANGFDPESALAMMNTAPSHQRAPHRKPRRSRNAFAAEAPPSMAAKAAIMAAGGESMEDMVASVRTILEAEEQKEREQARFAPALRSEPRGAGNGAFNFPEPAFAPCHRAQPGSYHGGHAYGFYEAAPPAFDLERAPGLAGATPAPKHASRGRGGNAALMAKIAGSIPRKARAGVAQTMQISLSREEALLLFGRARRMAAHGGEAACLAVTVRLTAPAGLVAIEPATPETQWLIARGRRETSGTWAWTAVPAASGLCRLKLSMSARDAVANGPGAVAALPDQTITVRVRGNVWSGFERFLREMFFLISGGALAILALKLAGRLT